MYSYTLHASFKTQFNGVYEFIEVVQPFTSDRLVDAVPEEVYIAAEEIAKRCFHNKAAEASGLTLVCSLLVIE